MTAPLHLADTQLAAFRRDGFLRIEALTDTAEIAEFCSGSTTSCFIVTAASPPATASN